MLNGMHTHFCFSAGCTCDKSDAINQVGTNYCGYLVMAGEICENERLPCSKTAPPKGCIAGLPLFSRGSTHYESVDLVDATTPVGEFGFMAAAGNRHVA